MNEKKHLEWAQQLVSRELYQAALYALRNLENSPQRDMGVDLGELYDLLGKVYVLLSDNRQGVEYFLKAISHAHDEDSRVTYSVHLGIAYRRLAEFDTCHRSLNQLLDSIAKVTSSTKGLLFVNLSTIQGINGFYEQAIFSVEKSLEALSTINSNHRHHVPLYNNLGMAYREIGEYDKAEEYLNKSLELGGNAFIEPLAELGKLYMLRGELSESIAYAKRALSLVWSSIINYEKEEIALLCHLLAQIAIPLQKSDVAIRLAEKAEVFYGQLGMWRQWQDIESEMLRWTENPPTEKVSMDINILTFDEIHHFLNSLDAINSQELIHKKMSQLIDNRVHYVKLLASALQLPQQDQDDLVLASRFADYGLTALENEVALNPHRSDQAFEQYKQHPSLSVRMIKTLHLSERIEDIVADHHENYDGTGYPSAKKQDEIHGLAKVLAVVDKYATGVVMEDKNHFDVLLEIVEQTGQSFDPNIVDVFKNMFELPEGSML